jgi:lipopolysaccharide/colanic/teichoic acid biosynthesis glycosyltransferase
MQSQPWQYWQEYASQLNTRWLVIDQLIYFFLKRWIDVMVSTLGLLVLAPLFAVIALFIRMTSPGPAFFVQQRVGTKRILKNGEWSWIRVDFPCYKFRTMKVNADASIHKAYVQALINDDQQAMAAIQQDNTKIRKLVRDPRVTSIGHLLRKTSLDELPQLWNILRGDMSLVGPRPAIPYEVDVYQPCHMQRLQAQPGLTGLQQVKARCTEDFNRQVQLDVEYIQNRSLWLDLKIILLTPWVVISGKGAH